MTGWNIDAMPTDGALPVPFWWARLREDPNFKDKVRARWNALRSGAFSVENVHSIIDESIELLGEAIDRNFEKWPVLGVFIYHNPFPIPQTYEEEITNMKNWFQGRFEWIDNNLDTL